MPVVRFLLVFFAMVTACAALVAVAQVPQATTPVLEATSDAVAPAPTSETTAATSESTAETTPAATAEGTPEVTTLQAGRGSFVADLMNYQVTVQTVWSWVLAKGPPFVTIVVLTFVVLSLARLLEDRFVGLITRTGKRGSEEERENRARTLTGVFHNAVTVVTIGFATVAILDLFGIAVSAVLGGAAVVGLAVAFGSQALIKDYFTGFILLIEQQYLINDVVTMNGVTGQVERITLRMTTLRDADGAVHFIPHGQVTIVTNQTHLWSRAVIDLPVSKEADVDATMAELVKLAKALREDPSFSKSILGEPMMLGVESINDSGAVVVRFFVKTKPLQQWPVKRELLRRIRKHFAELQAPRPPLKRTPAPTTTASPDADAEYRKSTTE